MILAGEGPLDSCDLAALQHIRPRPATRHCAVLPVWEPQVSRSPMSDLMVLLPDWPHLWGSSPLLRVGVAPRVHAGEVFQCVTPNTRSVSPPVVDGHRGGGHCGDDGSVAVSLTLCTQILGTESP